MNSLWILGHGPLLVDLQFVVDYERLRKHMTFNDVNMPADCREGVRLLYETLGVKYFTYTKYMNQTLGNFGYEAVKKITDHHIIVDMPTININASSHRSEIVFFFHCNVLNKSLTTINTYDVEVKMNMTTYNITVGCRVYK